MNVSSLKPWIFHPTDILIQLTSHMEHHDYAFYAMTGVSTSLAIVVAWAGFRKYVVRLYLSVQTPNSEQ